MSIKKREKRREKDGENRLWRAGKGKKRESEKERKRNNVDRKVGIKVWALVGKRHTKRHTHALTCSTVLCLDPRILHRPS